MCKQTDKTERMMLQDGWNFVGRFFAMTLGMAVVICGNSMDLHAQDVTGAGVNPTGASRPQPEVLFKVKFVEVDTNAVVANSARLGGKSTNNPLGFFPGTTNAPPSGMELMNSLIAAGDLPSASFSSPGQPKNTNATRITGILTDQQYRAVIIALEQLDATEVLTAPEAVVESGQTGKFEAVDIRQVPDGTVVSISSAAVSPGTTLLFPGPKLDVIPEVSSDNSSVKLTMMQATTDFIGYDNPGQFVPQASVPASQAITSVLPLPHFRSDRETNFATVYDGQTVALGGMIIPGKTREQVEAELDAFERANPPTAGRQLVRDEATISARMAKKNLMIFVTATIVNPDGMPFHTQAERDALLRTGPWSVPAR